MGWKSMTRRGCAAGFVLVLSLAGCSDEAAKMIAPAPPPGPDRTTRMGVVEMLAAAYESRDIETLGQCLDEDYQFWFAEEERSDPGWTWGDWIGKDEDLAVTGRMFDHERVTGIKMALANETAVPEANKVEECFWQDTAICGPDTVDYSWGIFGTDIEVMVKDTGSFDDPDTALVYDIDSGARLYFRADPDSEGLWAVWRIVDLGTEGRKGVEGVTWSGLKAAFRR